MNRLRPTLAHWLTRLAFSLHHDAAASVARRNENERQLQRRLRRHPCRSGSIYNPDNR